MSLASKLPFRHRHAAGFPGLGSQAVPTDADALDYLDRLAAADGTSVEVGVATAVDAFFRDSKAAGVFSALKACCILAGARTLAGALVPVVGDAPTNVADGFVEGDFSRTAGLTGDGATTYLDSGRAQDDDPQNDNHVAVYATSAISSNEAWIGNANRTGAFTARAIYWRLSPETIFGNANSTAFTEGAVYAGQANFAGITRSASDSQTLRSLEINYEDAQASVTPSSDNLYVFARNDTDGTLDHSDATIAFYSIGESLSLEDLDIAVRNLITAIGEAL